LICEEKRDENENNPHLITDSRKKFSIPKQKNLRREKRSLESRLSSPRRTFGGEQYYGEGGWGWGVIGAFVPTAGNRPKEYAEGFSAFFKNFMFGGDF
jgi:hypothetical protein